MIDGRRTKDDRTTTAFEPSHLQPATIATWPFNWRIIRYRPGMFLAHSLFVIFVFSLQIFPGLIEKAIFDTITGATTRRIRAAIWMADRALCRRRGGAGDRFLRRRVDRLDLSPRGRRAAAQQSVRQAFRPVLRRPGDRPLPVSPGEAINRFRNDVGEVADFPTWLPDQIGKIGAALVAIVIMARIDLTITVVIFVPLIAIIVVTRLAWGRILRYQRARAPRRPMP